LARQPLTGDGWQVDLLPGLIGTATSAHGYRSGAVARGWIGEAPVTVVVQVRELEGGFNRWVAAFAAPWLEVERRRITVPGASDAIRLDGFVEFDGLGAADERERCTAICAKQRRRGYVLTARSRPEDGVHEAFEPLLASFAVIA
jgi:hypothetical protein